MLGERVRLSSDRGGTRCAIPAAATVEHEDEFGANVKWLNDLRQVI